MMWTRTILLAAVCASVSACEPEDAAGSVDIDGHAGGDVFLRNRVALDMEIWIRPLEPASAPGCDEIADEPEALTTDDFADGRIETLSPHEITAVWPHAAAERECYAVWIESEGLGARILFWWDGDPPPRFAPTDCCSDGPGILQLMPTQGGWSLDLIGDTSLVHTPKSGE